jgi:uncharacterized protein YhaN
MARRTEEEKVEIAQQVFALMRKGNSAFKACQIVGIPQSTLSEWLNNNPALVEEYTRAREDLHEYIAAEIISIADAPVGSTESGATDNGAVQKQRLQIDSRKWLLSKLAPKKWGDKLELSGDSDRPIAIQQIERVIVKK